MAGSDPSSGSSRLLEIRVRPISRGSPIHFLRQSNLGAWAVPTHSAGRFRVIEFRHLMENLDVILQSEKPTFVNHRLEMTFANSSDPSFIKGHGKSVEPEAPWRGETLPTCAKQLFVEPV